MNKIYFLIFIIAATDLFASELIVVSPEDFKKQNPSQERNIIVDFIIDQFNNTNPVNTFSQEALDTIWINEEFKKEYYIGRFQIIDQKLYANFSNPNDRYFTSLTKYFKNLVQKYKIKDVDFVIYLRDELHDNNKKVSSLVKTFPAFMMSKNLKSSLEENQLLIPDAFMTEDDWALLIGKINQGNTKYPWDKKVSKIFWRGGAHGADVNQIKYNVENFSKLPRLTLVMLSKLFPDMIDAKFYGFGEFSSDKSGDDLLMIIKILEKDPIVRVDEVDHLKYKYLISIDGNTCSWKRVPWIMLSNSVLLKQETSNVEWFYPALKAYKHYIPIRTDLTDIFDKLKWLETHDREAQEITLNANNFVLNNLLPEHIDAYMVMILNKYHETYFSDKKLKISLKPSE